MKQIKIENYLNKSGTVQLKPLDRDRINLIIHREGEDIIIALSGNELRQIKKLLEV